MTGRLIFMIVVGILLAGCAPNRWCRDVPLGGVVILSDGRVHVCHETPEEMEVPSRR